MAHHLWYNSNSPGPLLKKMDNFIAHLQDFAPAFGLQEKEIGELRLAAEELKSNWANLKDHQPTQRKATTERNTYINNVFYITLGLINRLKRSPDWTDDYVKTLKIDVLQHDMGYYKNNRRRAHHGSFYSNEKFLEVLGHLKEFNEAVTNNTTPVWATSIELNNLNAGIDKVNGALNECAIVHTRHTMLLSELEASMLKLKKNVRSIVKYVKTKEGWTEEHAMKLNIHYLSVPGHMSNCKPLFQLKDCVKFVCINFAKIGINGMNIYSRLLGEIDFSFVGYAKRTRFKDPRPIRPYIAETREYRLNAVVGGKEIGEPSEVLSIRLGLV